MGVVTDLKGNISIDENGAVPGVVKLLESLLVDAKEGKIKAFAGTVVRSNHNAYSVGYTITGTVMAAIGGVTCLAYDLCCATDEGDKS